MGGRQPDPEEAGSQTAASAGGRSSLDGGCLGGSLRCLVTVHKLRATRDLRGHLVYPS